MPGGCNGLGTETFSGTLHAEHKHAFGCFKTELRGFGAKCVFTLVQPFLQLPHTPDFVQVQRYLDILQQTTPLNHPSFARNYDVYIIVVEASVVGDGIDNNAFSLTAGQATKVTDNRIQALFCDTDLDRLLAVEAL